MQKILEFSSFHLLLFIYIYLCEAPFGSRIGGGGELKIFSIPVPTVPINVQILWWISLSLCTKQQQQNFTSGKTALFLLRYWRKPKISPNLAMPSASPIPIYWLVHSCRIILLNAKMCVCLYCVPYSRWTWIIWMTPATSWCSRQGPPLVTAPSLGKYTPSLPPLFLWGV